LEFLTAHVWPGNVRELANVIEHAAILCDQLPIEPEHFPQRFAKRQLRGPLRPISLREIEMQAIYASIERHEGNKQAAAAELGISLKTLYNRLNQASQLKVSA
jgi:two-component system NtrC family response regulator